LREAAEQLVPSVMMHDGLADDGAKSRHAIGEPFRNVATVKRKIGAAGSSWHSHVHSEESLSEHKENASLRKVNTGL
jgi:hypothetical protein